MNNLVPGPSEVEISQLWQLEDDGLAHRAHSAASIARHPESSEIHALHAFRLIQCGAQSEAQSHIKTAIGLDGQSGIVHAIAGYIEVAFGHLEEGDRHFKCAIELSPESPRVWAMWTDVQFDRGDFDTFTMACDTWERLEGVTAHLLATRLAYAGFMGNTADAKAIAHRLRTEFADHAAAWTQLGMADLAERRFDDAEVWARKWIDHNPDDPRGWMILTLVLSKVNRPIEWREATNRLLECDPSSYAGYACKALFHEQEGRKKEARRLRRLAIEANPNFLPGQLLRRANLLAATGYPMRAHRQFERLAKRHPQWAATADRQALRNYLALGMLKQAQAVLQRSKIRGMDDALSAYAEAYLLSSCGRMSQAEKVITSALTRFPEDAMLWASWVSALEDRGEERGAVEAVHRAVSGQGIDIHTVGAVVSQAVRLREFGLAESFLVRGEAQFGRGPAIVRAWLNLRHAQGRSDEVRKLADEFNRLTPHRDSSIWGLIRRMLGI